MRSGRTERRARWRSSVSRSSRRRSVRAGSALPPRPVSWFGSSPADKLVRISFESGLAAGFYPPPRGLLQPRRVRGDLAALVDRKLDAVRRSLELDRARVGEHLVPG